MDMDMDSRIGLAGDWHGDLPWAIGAVQTLAAAGAKDIFHLGDFGIFSDPDGETYLAAVSSELRKHGMRILITPGNHEDYTRINATPVSEDGLQWLTDTLAVMPRGFRWQISSKTFVSLGGAASINFPDLREGISWWREEAITAGDIYRLAAGGTADYMLAHDAPTGISALEQSHRTGSQWSAEGLAYADESRRMVRAAVEIVRPRMFFHGHYHLGYAETATMGENGSAFAVEFVGLDMNGRARNLAVLDAVSGGIEYL